MIRTTKQLKAQLKDGYTIKNYGFRPSSMVKIV